MFEGFKDFEGKTYHTGHWPHEGQFGGAYESILAGKRVAQIGNGSSGIQALPEIAKVAEHVYHFQRTPQYIAPNCNAPIDQQYVKMVKESYQERRDISRATPAGILLTDGWGGAEAQVRPETGIWMGSAMDRTEQERNEIYEKLWKQGGLTFYFAFEDTNANDDSNNTLQEFMRNKIRSTVKDPKVAEMLCPYNYVGCKRPVVDQGYFETFNRDNVTLISITGSKSEKPKGSEVSIEKLTKKGIVTGDGKEYEVDVIVFAIGYDAMTG